MQSYPGPKIKGNRDFQTTVTREREREKPTMTGEREIDD